MQQALPYFVCDPPALQIQFMYPFISLSSFCSSFILRKTARLSTRSFSLANTLHQMA